MIKLRQIVLLFAIFVLGLLNIFIYWNSHLYYRAQKEDDDQKKIRLLEKSNKLYPLNDLVFYELGKSYLDFGLMRLNDAAASESSFRKSVQNLRKSILINPASPFSHFYLGQSLLNLALFSSGKDTKFYDEFRKAALLSGDGSQIFNEVGRLFLSRWPELSPEDQNFTLEILRKVVGDKDQEKIALLLNIWELNAKDYQIIEKILPADAQVYRQYAEFLGEKSLFLEERHKYLALADILDFARAKSEFQSGEMQLGRFQTEEAFGYFKTSLDLLGGIRFYQASVVKDSISNSEYADLLKSTLLDLAKCRIEEGAGLSEVVSYLSQYLSLEDRTAKIGELERYLRDRGALPGKFDKSSNDLTRLAIELSFQFKQTKFREIVNFGRELEKSFVVVPEAKKQDYVRILLLVGDSYQKVDFLYDAGDIYQKALDIGPNNLETLLRIRNNSDRLNEDKKLEEINKVIEKLMAPKEINLQSLRLNKGEMFSRSLILDGQSVVLDLQFQTDEKSEAPLISVFFNNRVVWDDYLKDSAIISLPLETKAGDNALQIIPINLPISLTKLIYRLRNENENLSVLRR